jgi:hypothetical protein
MDVSLHTRPRVAATRRRAQTLDCEHESSLLKNLRLPSPFPSFAVGFLVCLSRFFGLRADSASGGDELGDAHEIVGDEIEHEVGSDGCDASMFGLAHRAVLLPQPKMHSAILRQVWEIW